MSDITDTPITDDSEGLTRLFALSPYCEWVSLRYGLEAAISPDSDPMSLQSALAALWDAQTAENAGLAGDGAILTAQQRIIRRFRHLQLFQILSDDLAGAASVETTLGRLSNLADACIRQAVLWGEASIVDRFGTAQDQDGKPVRLLVLGMGKLGGRELNVSSDVDLIIAYRSNGKSTGPKVIETSDWCRRVALRATQILHAITEDSFAYRVDTRLRPFGESGPLVMSFDGMENYYLTQGRNWERYAMVKARVIVGEESDASDWENLISPFVYRRYLDYSTIEALADLKKKINTNLSNNAVQKTSSTWNLKLGHGGIREIEFIVQSFQLVRGGRDPELQGRELLPMLDALLNKELLTIEDCTALGDAYRFLRRAENALQGMRDQQTHTLPEQEEDKDRLINWMGFDDWADFDAELQRHRASVTQRFDDVFRGSEPTEPTPLSVDEALSAQGIEPDEALLAGLHDLTEGRLYQRLTANAQKRIDRILPTMIELSASEPNPVEALTRCLTLVRVVAGRSGYLQVLIEQPVALHRLVHVLSRSSWIVEFITKHPIVIDELLGHSSSADFPAQAELLERTLDEAARVADEELDVQMDVLRHFQKAHECRVAVAELTDDLPLMKVSDQLTWLAESMLAAVMQLVYARLEAIHGKPYFEINGQRLAASVGVVAYGKLGGLELAHGSDLDVVFLHDSAGDAQQTDGQKPIPNTQFYARLAQRTVSFMTTLTPAGILYDVDLRLRPNGSSGVLVTGIDSFERYQTDSAWTWEHQALTRARMVYGPDSLAEKFVEVRRRILGKPRDQAMLSDEVASMRRKMREHLGSKSSEGDSPEGAGTVIDLKQDAGGLADIEFIVQYLVLANGGNHPELIEFTDNVRQLEAAERVGVISPEIAGQLKEHYLAFRTILHRRALQGHGKQLIEDAELAHRRLDVRTIWQHVLPIDS